jgi:hypothetical protein
MLVTYRDETRHSGFDPLEGSARVQRDLAVLAHLRDCSGSNLLEGRCEPKEGKPTYLFLGKVVEPLIRSRTLLVLVQVLERGQSCAVWKRLRPV